jgi:hypothetical protein
MSTSPSTTRHSPSLQPQDSANSSPLQSFNRSNRPPSNRERSSSTLSSLSKFGLTRATVHDNPASKIAQRHAEGLRRVDFLSNQMDRLSISVEKRKVELATLKNMNENLDDELLELSHRTGNSLDGKGLDDAQKMVNHSIKKTLYKLETLLEKNLTVVDTENAKQQSIKTKINQYRQKKIATNVVNKKLEKKLELSKKDLTDHLHDLQHAQEERLNTESHIMALKKMLEGVDHTFSIEWSSLTSRLNKERHDIEEVQRRSAAESHAINWEEEVGKGGSILKAVRLHEKRQNTLKAKAQNVQWEAAKQRMSYRQAQAQLDEYRESLALLNKRLNIHTSDDLLNRFERMENQNFEKLKQVNELIAEESQLELKKASIMENISEIETKAKTNQMHLIKEQESLDNKENNINKYIELVNHRLTSVTSIVHQLINGVEHIYNHLDCLLNVKPAADGAIIGGTTLTPLNLMLYLGIIQQRTNNMLLLAKKNKRDMMIQNEIDDQFNNNKSSKKGVQFYLKADDEHEENEEDRVIKLFEASMSESQAVAGPVSPVRDLHHRLIHVNLNDMSKQLEQMDRVQVVRDKNSNRHHRNNSNAGRNSLDRNSPGDEKVSPMDRGSPRGQRDVNEAEQTTDRELSPPRFRTRSRSRSSSRRRRSISRLSDVSSKDLKSDFSNFDSEVVPLSRDELMDSMRETLLT